MTIDLDEFCYDPVEVIARLVVATLPQLSRQHGPHMIQWTLVAAVEGEDLK